MIPRRTFLAASVAGLALPRFALAETSLSGGGSLVTVSDGNLVLPPSLVFEPAPQDLLPAVLEEFEIGDSLTPECNLALLRQGERVVLFDTGSGHDFQPSAGKLLDALDAAGVAPGDITDVIFTHAHPDHIWGVLDDFDDPMFPEAAHHIGAAELAYWTDPATLDTIGEARTTFAVGAARRLEAIADRLQTFDGGAEVVPGVEAISTPGHTPGHMSFQVENVLIIGDAIANHHVAFARPEWPSGSDQDLAMGAKTRVALFDRIKADGLSVAGFHLPQGGMGEVEKVAEGYRFIPA